jgi:hypothetical protein
MYKIYNGQEFFVFGNVLQYPCEYDSHFHMTVCVKMECFVSLQTKTAAVASAASAAAATAAAAAVTGVLVNEVNQTGKRAFIIHICSPYTLSFTSYLS